MYGIITCMGQRTRVIRFSYKRRNRTYHVDGPLRKFIAARLKAGTAVVAWETPSYYRGTVGQQKAIWFERSGNNLRLEDGNG